jgi:hypothetical protein
MLMRVFSSRPFLFVLLLTVFGLGARIIQVASEESFLARALRRIKSTEDKKEVERIACQLADLRCGNPELAFEAGKLV